MKTNMDKPTSWGVREWAVVVTMLMNFGGIVWGAAVMHSSVGRLEEAVLKLNLTTGSLVADIARIQIDYNARLSVLESEHRRLEVQNGRN